MSRSTAIATRPQLALQSYLDGLLQDAAVELEQELSESSLDEFEAAVREEQIRDARLAPRGEVRLPALPREAEIVVAPVVEAPPAISVEPISMPPLVEPLAEVYRPAAQIASVLADGRPDWAQEPFECLLFDVAGLTLAVPLVCLGSIYPLAGQDLTPLFGQPDWFLGILPSQSGNLKVLDTARWVMPDRYRDDFRQGLQYVISVQGYEWGLAVHQVSRSIRLNPDEIKWRSQRAQRPWLAGTVIEHMCALLDVSALAELIASGATKRMGNGQVH
ncbi:purine-binding chemotaxis protein CheW [Pseudomonas flavescens]|uniref:Purine-binding chemotaxis protein CheW n=1 Tax=Phytopseudomonas flavescens TaxID=29435 RepID=A0A1G8LAC3_9GAMM|nr:CheW domain-containing protein [Pseudomonas flavescens]SDI52621.1 purine-binding chemotaxis protein CheW [Pseudomonas flavescens]